MKDLIERLEKATGPDRDLDFDISWFLNEPFGAWESFQKYDAAFPTYTRRDARGYTASIDAALTLAPEGFEYKITKRAKHPYLGIWPAEAWVYAHTLTVGAHGGFGETPAIALCIAALKARSAHAKEGGAG